MAGSFATCRRCGRPMDKDMKCTICGLPLCIYNIRELEGYGILCPKCYEDLSFQYHSRKCDILK
jgi:hypothetical protein